MRILHVIHSLDPARGGPVEGIRLLGSCHLREGRQVEVVTLDPPTAPFLASFPIQTHPLGPAHGNYGYTPRLIPWLQAHAAEYDAVIVNGLWQFPGLAVWKTLRRSKIPYYVFTHGMLDPWFKQAYPIKHLKKWLYWPWAEYRVLRDATAVFFTCEEERRLAQRSFWLYRCREIVLGYGTDSPPGQPAQQRALFFNRFPQCAGKRLWLFLGRLEAKKGCDLLLQAFAPLASRFPDLHLVMAGPDQAGWQSQLVALAKTLGIESKISWPGLLSDDLKWGAFHAAETFILPSHQENFGLAVAEALACGLPVLITNKVNIWREIETDQAGLVEEDTLTGVQNLAHRWLQLPELSRRRMRENAANCFRHRFEIRQVADRLTQHLQGLS